jgi:hypothetical protein
VPGKFVPGHETESVLKLTKRSKLRPKDESHRRSLGGGPPPLAALPGENDSISPRAPVARSWAPSNGFDAPPQRDSLAGLFASTVLASHFLVVLAFGHRQVTVPGSSFMTVGDLRLTAGAIAEMDPASLMLMHGEITLGLGTSLGDYEALFTPHAFHVTVVSMAASTSPRLLPSPLPVPARSLHLTPTLPGTESPTVPTPHVTPLFRPNEPSFLILVVFEDGSTMAPVVCASKLGPLPMYLLIPFIFILRDQSWIWTVACQTHLPSGLGHACTLSSRLHAHFGSWCTSCRAAVPHLPILRPGLPLLARLYPLGMYARPPWPHQ